MKKQLAGLLAVLLLVGLLAGCAAKADTPTATDPTVTTTAPTEAPTEPSVAPSEEASTAPTAEPTTCTTCNTEPSAEPTVTPSAEPSTEPSAAPTVAGTTPSGLEIVDLSTATTKPAAEFKENADGTMYAEIAFTKYVDGEAQTALYEVARTKKDGVSIIYCKEAATGHAIVIELSGKAYTAYECRAGKEFRALSPFVTQAELQYHYELFNGFLSTAAALPLSKTTILETNDELAAAPMPEGFYAGEAYGYTLIKTKEVKEDLDGDGKKDKVQVKDSVLGIARVDKATGLVTLYTKLDADGNATYSYAVKSFNVTNFQIPQYK